METPKIHYIQGFNERMQQAVNNSNLPTTEIARKCGIDRKVIYRSCYDFYMPNSSNLAKICVVLNVSADWLLGLKR